MKNLAEGYSVVATFKTIRIKGTKTVGIYLPFA